MRFDSLNRTCLRLIAKLAYDLNTILYGCASSEAFVSQLYFDCILLGAFHCLYKSCGYCTVLRETTSLKFFRFSMKEQSCFYLFGRQNLFDATTKSDDFVPTILI